MADFPISPVVRRVVYTGSAGTGPYAFTFEILAQTDIDVYVDSTLKTLTTDYTVSINANGTGSVTFVTAPGSTTRITIVGARDITRASDYVTGGDFTAASLNVELDQQTIFNQQNAEALGRAILAPVTDPASINMVLPVQTSRAGKILAFDSTGNPTVGEEIGNWRGNWAAGQAYTVRDLVKDASNANVYRANTAHTSSGTTPISSNADVAKWDLVVDAASAASSASAAAASASAAASSASAASTSASNASTSATNAASSASAASTSASNASTSATNASNSASSASSSASTATTQASNASTSASNAATSATSASNSASTATTQATNASNSASAASTSATNAASSASAASTSASNASTSATNASNSASTATTQATNSANSATASAASAVSAASSAASAAALLDNFDDRYLGAKTGDPSVDNDGNALLIGALYFNTTDGVMKVYTASGWIAASSASVATLATFEFVATAGQTVFSGADANSATLSYVAPALIVTLNGVRLRPGDDYTATNGTSITLVSAAALNDELVVDAFGSFLVANAVDLTTTQTIAGIKSFSNPITASAGTVSAPGITTTGDSNTGIFFPAADTIAFAEGGAEVMRIDSSANINVGSTSNVYNSKLGVASSSAFPISATTSAVAGIALGKTTDGAGNHILFTSNNSSNYGIIGVASANGTSTGDVYTLGYSPSGGAAATQVASWTSTGNFRFNSGFGSAATAYGCRAWVNFSGNGTPAIRSSGNVSSITDHGTGLYSVNLTTAMPDANYSVCASASSDSTFNGYYESYPGVGDTSAFRIRTGWQGTLYDLDLITGALFR
jgi:hypothetical protein